MVTTETASDGAQQAWLAAGAKVLTVPPAAGGTGVDLAATLEVLAELGVLQALVEGGAALSGSLVEAGLADRLVTYVAPTMLGRDGRPALDFAGPAADRRRRPLAPGRRRPRRHRRPPRLRAPPPRGAASVAERRGQSLMFTGIVEELGTVRAVTPNEGGARIEIAATRVLEDAELGASIAVNGCCLTVVELGPDHWAADAVTETLDRTSLGAPARRRPA